MATAPRELDSGLRDGSGVALRLFDRPTPAGAAHEVAFDAGPGREMLLRGWTEAQWSVLRPEERPGMACQFGPMWVVLIPRESPSG